MAQQRRITRHLVSILFGLAIGGATVWGVFMFALRPSEHEYRIRTAGHYAQQMSYYGVGRLASFKDCTLEPPEAIERLRGINWVGTCTTSARGTGYVYAVRLDSWARHKGAEFRVLAP
jgi:hypothetical protein